MKRRMACLPSFLIYVFIDAERYFRMDIADEFQETYNEFLLRKADYMNLPMMGTIELTPVCNLNCKMCYIRQNQDEVLAQGGLKSIDFWEDVIDQAIEEGMMFCLLTGGEIFTYPGFRTLYIKMKQKGIHIVLNTNGTMLDRDTIEWLAKEPPRRLNISLYGATPETYEHLTGQRDGYKRVIQAFTLLKEYNIPFRVHGVLVPSMMDDYEKMKEICNRFQVPMQLSYYMFPPLRKESKEPIEQERFTPEEMAKTALRYRKDQSGGDKKIWYDFLKAVCHDIEHPETHRHYGDTHMHCRSGVSAFWVNWKGEVSGCGVSDDDIHSLEQVSFADAWKAISQYTKEVEISKKCSTCCYLGICPVCAAGAYCETGMIDGAPEYLCEFCRYYSALLKEEFAKLKEEESL